MSCDIRVGTSGFHYRHWKGPFYPSNLPANRMLEYYTHYFDTVELNNSFYRLPTSEAFDVWRDTTPTDFVFAVKASRFLTHNKKLKNPENALNKLLPRVTRLKKKLGPILFQLPPNWRVNLERLENLMAVLPRDLRYAFECRDLSWINPDVLRLLSRFHSAFCIYELAGYHSPLHVTSDFAYVRLHGPAPGKYQGSYSDNRLREWALRIKHWGKELKAVFVYFDNDQSGYAAQNALALKGMLQREGLMS